MNYIRKNITPRHLEAEEIKNHIGESVTVHGMIYKIRQMSGFSFVILQCKRYMLQCVYSGELPPELCENTAVIIHGIAAALPKNPMGAEVQIESFEILSRPVEAPSVVVNNKEIACSLETLLDNRPITMRNERERAIFRLQAGICRGVRDFLNQNGFTEIHSPKIVKSGAEGGSNIFGLEYFGQTAYLAQSPQFYKQMMVGVFERVYEIAPVFRAEKFDTSRHINEYTSIDFEMGFINSFYEICEMETAMLSYLFSFLREEYAAEAALLGAKIPIINEIPMITFDEAKRLISKTYNRPIDSEPDFEPEEEKLLSEIIERETGSELVFVTHYKSIKRPFYALETPNNTDVTESFDLLFRGTEITTGGARIHDYEMQVQKMRRLGMNIDDFADFLMAHKCGLPPHGGLGLGLERLTARLLNFANIRRTTMFPRDTKRLKP